MPRRTEPGQQIGEIQAEILAKQDLKKQRMYFPNPPRPGIYLLKIHGALDEFALNDGLELQIPIHRGQSFRRIADSVPVIADSFR